MALPLYIADAFTTKKFAGNPAAVCLVKENQCLNEAAMQEIAAEMNLSETAFIQELPGKDGFDTASEFGLRWFTPTNEVNLCGHATLASAAVLFNTQGNNSSTLCFHTASGDLIVARQGDHDLRMTFPANPPATRDRSGIEDIINEAAGGLPVSDVQYSPATKKLLVRLADNVSRSELEALKPDTRMMLELHDGSVVKGVMLTLKGQGDASCANEEGEHYDFLSRMFAPWNGIPEDPVTGSAHTVLGCYWAKQLKKSKLFARQCSARGGDLHIEVLNNGKVTLTGRAVIVLAGSISV